MLTCAFYMPDMHTICCHGYRHHYFILWLSYYEHNMQFVCSHVKSDRPTSDSINRKRNTTETLKQRQKTKRASNLLFQILHLTSKQILQIQHSPFLLSFDFFREFFLLPFLAELSSVSFLLSGPSDLEVPLMADFSLSAVWTASSLVSQEDLERTKNPQHSVNILPGE